MASEAVSGVDYPNRKKRTEVIREVRQFIDDARAIAKSDLGSEDGTTILSIANMLVQVQCSDSGEAAVEWALNNIADAISISE